MKKLTDIVNKWHRKFDFKDDNTEDIKLLSEQLNQYTAALNYLTGGKFPAGMLL